ncbi:hypothetical protein AB4455_25735 [Vibrio sp. 10N.261.46.E12]|uniref:hypothetical protein n=1 Tax=unclassified Vibrio TaxID=2614977 RepID=UPI00097809CB|nr:MULTISPECIES: hypothetical protein [unclassified Vibrio]OMO37714.1 hypothetical protein BH584_21215 [Vibrio sp. 10N.261.45.E1]PMJ27627.1 hypothetical protein BCU27_06535 [Vibrio sp. 10N.286.45.B6]PML93591.1 hypothetical protein BCT66_24530 [Vibrio sp. 10N.261.49.E11]PMM69075.1 hypothetical protein BCT48_11590 [Vibrio sp. 10N.261.46.F12]PMM84664.1 hypothetical protein BCT46_10205 [Vibrio sp. 10N.261.46.E8]
MHIANNKHVILEIANHYKLAFPCIKHALETDNARKEINAVQHRLLTYKEVLLHGSMLEEKELKLAFSALNQNEKGVAQGGIQSINKAIIEMDKIIDKYSRKALTGTCI